MGVRWVGFHNKNESQSLGEGNVKPIRSRPVQNPEKVPARPAGGSPPSGRDRGPPPRTARPSGLDDGGTTPLAGGMRAVLQRVSRASVEVEDRRVGAIGEGLLILLGISREDGDEDLDWLARRIPRLRLFDDEEGVPNRSAVDIGGGFLVISQFTLHADTRKGNRPSYRRAADPAPARALYERF